MSYYRINNNLTVKDKIIKGNTIYNLDISKDKIDKLLSIGVISIISTPPLAFMPLWEMRAETLLKAGVVTGLDFLNSKDKEISSLTGKSIEMIQQWKQDLINDLIVPIERCCQ